VLRQHADDFSELRDDIAHAFVGDTQMAARVIRKVTGAPRINYAILGNVESHVHFHLIPRGHKADPIPNLAPWAHPVKRSNLDHEQAKRLMSGIRSAISKELALGQETTVFTSPNKVRCYPPR